MSSLEKKFALAVRCCHWVNVAVLLVMLWSGLMIYWPNPPYRIGLGSVTLFTLFPDAIFSALGVPYRLAEGMSIHFFFMWFFAINGLIYVAYTGLSGEYRELLPNRRSFREAIQVALHDLGLSHVEPPPRKFNGAQQIAYTAVILMGAGSLSTGLAIYKPVQYGWLARLLGGSEWARWEHFWLAAGYVVFFVIHVAQVARAGWGTFGAMVTGYDVVNPADRRDRRASGLAPARPLEKRRSRALRRGTVFSRWASAPPPASSGGSGSQPGPRPTVFRIHLARARIQRTARRALVHTFASGADVTTRDGT